jgi:hypothetical protein
MSEKSICFDFPQLIEQLRLANIKRQEQNQTSAPGYE